MMSASGAERRSDMKILRDRQEMAMAMNFGKYPVVEIDLADRDEYGLVSKPVRIDNGTFKDGLPYWIESEIRIFRDEKKIVFRGFGSCLKSSFGYSDIANMVRNANAPLIGKDTEFVLWVHNSETGDCFYPVILKTGARVNPHCTTVMSLCDEDKKDESLGTLVNLWVTGSLV